MGRKLKEISKTIYKWNKNINKNGNYKKDQTKILEQKNKITKLKNPQEGFNRKPEQKEQSAKLKTGHLK